VSGEVLVVVPDHEEAVRLRAVLSAHGVEAELHRELLAGDDDAEDVQWVLVIAEARLARGGVDDDALRRLAHGAGGWVEHGTT
jgi:putative hydrolase of the HAD superfamily